MKGDSWRARHARSLWHGARKQKTRKPKYHRHRQYYHDGQYALDYLSSEAYDWLSSHTHKWRIQQWPRSKNIAWNMLLSARHGRTGEYFHSPGESLPKEKDVKIGVDGFVPVKDFLMQKSSRYLAIAPQDVNDVIVDDGRSANRIGKRRFRARFENGNVTAFAALQGHTFKAAKQINMDLCLHRLETGDSRIPELLYHGTHRKRISSIFQNGLVAGGLGGDRVDVHLTGKIIGTQERAGVRGSADTVIVVDGTGLAEDPSVIVRRSDNDVYLTNFVDPWYCLAAVNRSTGFVFAKSKSGRDIRFRDIKRLMNKGSDVSTHLSDVESISSDEPTKHDHLNDEELRAKIAYLEAEVNWRRACAVKAANDE